MTVMNQEAKEAQAEHEEFLRFFNHARVRLDDIIKYCDEPTLVANAADAEKGCCRSQI
jgi:hypothetical protein